MNILSLSIDEAILDPTSAPAKRMCWYADIVDRYDIVVASKKKKKLELHEKIHVYGSGGSNKMCQFFQIFLQVRTLLLSGKYHILTSQDQYFLGLIGYLLSRIYKKPLEIQVHGWERGQGIRLHIAQFILPRAQAVRVVSERLKKDVIERMNVQEKRITVVPIYVEITKEFPQKRYAKKENEPFIFLTVGRLVPVKCIALQLRALSQLKKSGKHVVLWIVGDGQLRDELEHHAKELHIEEQVVFWGQKSYQDVQELYQQADCFLLTSESEGWGRVVIEAASFGLPIIMTDVGMAGEVINNNKEGLVISVHDIQMLVQNMDMILGSGILREVLVEGAYARIRTLSTKEDILARYQWSWENCFRNSHHI